MRYHAETVKNPYKTNEKHVFLKCEIVNQVESHLTHSPQLVFLSGSVSISTSGSITASTDSQKIPGWIQRQHPKNVVRNEKSGHG